MITAVWGAAYVDLYLNLVIPTQLSPGNLAALASAKGSCYRIYTTQSDAANMVKHPAIQAIHRIMPVEFTLMDHIDTSTSTRYAPMTACHRHALTTANQQGAALVFLSPDAIFSDGSFAQMDHIARQGKRAIMVGSYRLDRDAFAQAVKSRYPISPGGSIRLVPRELVGLSLDHLHPFTQGLIWGHRDFNRLVSHTYWLLPQRGVLARCFHLHPMLVRPERPEVMPPTTIDGDYLRHACPDLSHFHVVTDSDEIAVVELSCRDDPGLLRDLQPGGGQTLENIPTLIPGGSLRALAIANWARGHTDWQHRHFFAQPIRFHAGDLDAVWQAVQQESDGHVRDILQWIEQDAEEVHKAFFGRSLADNAV